MSPETTFHIAEMFDLALWSQWFAEMGHGFSFLVLLPVIAIVIGLWAEYSEQANK